MVGPWVYLVAAVLLIGLILFLTRSRGRAAAADGEPLHNEEERAGAGQVGRSLPQESEEQRSEAEWKKEEERLRLKEEQKEEEERKAQEEQARREHEEYLKLKEAFVVEEEGVSETMTEEQSHSFLTEFINYIKKSKVVLLEDLAFQMGLRTQDAINRIQDLLTEGTLTGVIDDRGKFIYITPEELAAVANFIRQRGRVSITADGEPLHNEEERAGAGQVGRSLPQESEEQRTGSRPRRRRDLGSRLQAQRRAQRVAWEDGDENVGQTVIPAQEEEGIEKPVLP